MAIKVLTLEGVKTLVKGIKDWATALFVQKEEGKGLSSNDYTTVEKDKLAGIAEGAQVNVIEDVKVNGEGLAVDGKAVNIDLSAYALKADIVNAMYFRGIVATVDALPTDAGNGDIYHVEADAGEYIWIEEKGEWQSLGAILDLSAYSTTEQMNAAIAAAVAPKANAADVYTKTEVDGQVSAINTELAKKANAADVYIKTEVDGKLALKADKTELESAVSTINTEIAKKADASAVYTKTEVDSAVGAVDAKFANYYTSVQVDGKLADYILASDIVAITDAEIAEALA